MPSPGLSLVGFLEEERAIKVLRDSCVFPDVSNAALGHQWKTAVSNLGQAIPKAGAPELLPMPASSDEHISKLKEEPWFQDEMEGELKGSSFHMVELDALLAMQFHVDQKRCDHHSGNSTSAPSDDEVLRTCLPLQPAMENVRVSQGKNSMLVTSKGMNFYPAQEGWIERDCGIFVGLRVDSKLPLLHVVKHKGRYFLHNGFHRAVGLRQRGITHAPCIFREVQNDSAAGFRADGGTFDPGLFESSNPPTVGHFTQGRALKVLLKTFTRTIHVSWADHITTDD